MFTKNVGATDRALRIALGLALIAAFFIVGDAPWRWFLLIGVVPLATGLISRCPIYALFGLSTCPLKSRA